MSLQRFPTFIEAMRAKNKLELAAIKVEVSTGLDKLRTQIEEAKAMVRVGGKRSDPRWFAETLAKIRDLGRKDQTICLVQAEQAERVKAANLAHARNQEDRLLKFNAAFFKASRRMLDQETFNAICDTAEAALASAKKAP